MLFIPIGMKSENKRVGSFNLTEEGYQSLLAIEKKTNQSRKEIVSNALSVALGNAMNQVTVSFRLPDPQEMMMLRTEVLHLETSADQLIKALFGVRPKDPEQAKILAGTIQQLQDYIANLRAMDDVFKKKQHLLKELSFSDYRKIPALIEVFEQQKEIAKGKHDEAKRLSRAELILKILRTVV
jgi:hypothetical protein